MMMQEHPRSQLIGISQPDSQISWSPLTELKKVSRDKDTLYLHFISKQHRVERDVTNTSYDVTSLTE